jgi:uncharacterized membrane protein
MPLSAVVDLFIRLAEPVAISWFVFLDWIELQECSALDCIYSLYLLR